MKQYLIVSYKRHILKCHLVFESEPPELFLSATYRVNDSFKSGLPREGTELKRSFTFSKAFSYFSVQFRSSASGP
jgi:hypothetical protein